jgi:hypothetical protein
MSPLDCLEQKDDGRWVVGTNGVAGYWLSKRVRPGATAREWILDRQGLVKVFDDEKSAVNAAKNMNRQ